MEEKTLFTVKKNARSFEFNGTEIGSHGLLDWMPIFGEEARANFTYVSMSDDKNALRLFAFPDVDVATFEYADGKINPVGECYEMCFTLHDGETQDNALMKAYYNGHPICATYTARLAKNYWHEWFCEQIMQRAAWLHDIREFIHRAS